jgi:hypothetical protein
MQKTILHLASHDKVTMQRKEEKRRRKKKEEGSRWKEETHSWVLPEESRLRPNTSRPATKVAKVQEGK